MTSLLKLTQQSDTAEFEKPLSHKERKDRRRKSRRLKKAAHKIIEQGIYLRDCEIAPPTQRLINSSLAQQAPADHVPLGVVLKQVHVAVPNSKISELVYRVEDDSWLARYLRRGKISKSEYDAGLKFQQAWEYSLLGVQTHDSTMMEVIDCAAKGNGSKSPMPYSQRVIREALGLFDSMREAPLKLLVIKVCGNNEAAGDTYRIATLRRALEKMAYAWGL